MERFPTAQRLQTPVVAAPGVGRILSRLIGFATRLGRPSLDGPPDEPAWRSYAVYSGALPLRRHKSSRRQP